MHPLQGVYPGIPLTEHFQVQQPQGVYPGIPLTEHFQVQQPQMCPTFLGMIPECDLFVRVSYGGGGMVIIGLSQVSNNNLVPDFVRSNLRGSKFNIFLAGGGGGGGGEGGYAPRPP